MVENLLAKQFEHFVKIDLEERVDLHIHFSGNLDPKEILRSLEISVGKIIPGKTLLFFDEIQSCPRAIMALRYFYEKMPELHVVAAGSLLEFASGDISFPVGRVQYLHVFPMTFYEYLLAVGNEPMAELTQRFVAQEMLAWNDTSLFYWARDAKSSNAEVDYLAVCDGEIYPIEVKSGTGGSLRSLHLMLQTYQNCPEGIVLYSGAYKKVA